MDGQSPLVRQWILLRSLSARRCGATVAEMAAETGVNDKTIRRDLQTFREAGFPLEETVGDFGRKTWRLPSHWNQPAMSFTFDEAVALYLGRRLLEPLAGTYFWDAAQRAFKKIRACLGKPALDYLEKMAGTLYETTVGVSDYSKKAELLDQIMRGMEESKAIHIAYQSLRATEPTTIDVYPYGLTYHRGSLYLIAHSPEHNDVRHYKVDRIEEAEISQFPFQRPERFDLGQHLADSFGIYQGKGNVRVVIRFAPPVVRYVQESKWHASQQLTKQKDGSLLAEFRLSNTEEIKRWVMSFGRHAVAVHPEQLRTEIEGEFAESLAQYQTTRPRRRSAGRKRRRKSGHRGEGTNSRVQWGRDGYLIAKRTDVSSSHAPVAAQSRSSGLSLRLAIEQDQRISIRRSEATAMQEIGSNIQLRLPSFDETFLALTGNRPFPWQRELYDRFVSDRPDSIPASCNLPTGLGKTSVVAIWLIALANRPDRIPRRLVYVVNRRTVVDQTTEEKLRRNISAAGMCEPLQALCATKHDIPLAISTLRGQFADNREWSADPSRPAVICGTVNMIGSRLLFSGYRVGFKAKPLHAGFLGQDALLVHDEAHLEPAFQELIETIQYEQDCREQTGKLPWPKLRVMELTATSAQTAIAFQILTNGKRTNPIPL